MTPKECRSAFNAMIHKLAQVAPDPEHADPKQMHITIEMHKLQALWEIAAQLSEMNEHGKTASPLSPV